MLGIKKHIAVSVNKESVNTSISLVKKCISPVLAFFDTFYWLLSKILETKFLEKNNNPLIHLFLTLIKTLDVIFE